jgi:gliding motility-associated-like protein
VVTLDKNPGLCIGSTRTLQAGIFSSYLWQDGSQSASLVVTGTGTYYVTVVDNNQCTGSDTVHITALLPVPSNFLPEDTAMCNYGTLLIKSEGSYDNYHWSNNSTSTSINIAVPGLYWLQVNDANSCTGLDSILVGLKECIKGFHIPSAFTPGNDGLNDYYKPIIGGIVKQYRFTIYNRWGQTVFTTKEQYKGWDGNLGGIPQDTNVFAWTCTYQLEGETVKQEKGTVVVIR